MSQQVQELISKIKEEGVLAAEQKGKDIEAQAKKEAQRIIDHAKQEAVSILGQAAAEAKKLKESTQVALQQSSRDTILSLKKEIQRILKKIISHEIHEVLSGDHLAQIIEVLIQGVLEGKENVEVSLSPKDLEKLKQGFMAKLQKQLKTSIKFQAASGITHGFTISFDSGKSCFEFTEEGLAEYLSTFLNSQISSLVKDSV